MRHLSPKKILQKKYWEYLSLEGSTGEDDFYKNGVLIIILCMVVEYIDTTSGDSDVLGRFKIDEIIASVQACLTNTAEQNRLKDITLMGLEIATSMTDYDLLNSNGYEHPEIEGFFSGLAWVDETFIKLYFRTLI